MDYNEKLIWVQFVPLAVGSGYFALSAMHGGAWPIGFPIFAFCVLEAVVCALLSAMARREPKDERVRLIEFKAFKIAYFCLMVVVCLWSGAAALHVVALSSATLATAFFAAWFGLEAIHTGVQVVLYRTRVQA